MAEQAFITTTLLLSRLHDSRDGEAWRLFDDRFRGVIVSAAHRLGLSEADAEEAAQETLLQALRDYQAGRYDRSRGRLSSWIVTIAHHRILDLRRRRRREHPNPADTPAADPDPAEVAQAFDLALERRIFEQAWDRVRAAGTTDERTLRAFELTALRGVPPAEAATQCSMSVDQVYVARNRVSRKLREAAEDIGRAVRDGW